MGKHVVLNWPGKPGLLREDGREEYQGQWEKHRLRPGGLALMWQESEMTEGTGQRTRQEPCMV